MPGLRASPAVGLVEGLAVALEPPDGLPTPTDLVLAAQNTGMSAQGLEQDPADVARATMDPIGFWTTRAGVAYTTSGAFVADAVDNGLEFGAAASKCILGFLPICRINRIAELSHMGLIKHANLVVRLITAHVNIHNITTETPVV